MRNLQETERNYEQDLLSEEAILNRISNLLNPADDDSLIRTNNCDELVTVNGEKKYAYVSSVSDANGKLLAECIRIVPSSYPEQTGERVDIGTFRLYGQLDGMIVRVGTEWSYETVRPGEVKLVQERNIRVGDETISGIPLHQKSPFLPSSRRLIAEAVELPTS